MDGGDDYDDDENGDDDDDDVHNDCHGDDGDVKGSYFSSIRCFSVQSPRTDTARSSTVVGSAN